MTNRRGARPTHVRPRPPSSGRPAPAPARPRAPAPGRLTTRSPVRRTRGVPIVIRLALAAGVLALTVGVIYVGFGGLTTVAGKVGSTLTGFVDDVTSTPVPSVTTAPVSDAPRIAPPAEPYTNEDQVDLVITVPSRLVGGDYRIRLYLQLEGQAAAPIDEAPVGPGPTTIIPVTLTEGINDLTATLIGPGGESESSAVVRYVLDKKQPSIKVTSPRDGATVNRKAVTIEGRSQGRSTLIARNQTTGDSIVGQAGGDGAFKVSLPITMGANAVEITATDPAGNSATTSITVTRGSGTLRASLSASNYSYKRSALPSAVQLAVTVDDPDGKPLAGARVTFTLSIPRIKSITGEGTTDANGRATFATTIPKGADRGGGSAGVLVRTSDFGTTTDKTVITIR